MKTFLLNLSEEFIYPIDIYCRHKGISRTDFFKNIVNLWITNNLLLLSNIAEEVNQKLLSYKKTI